ncbi:MAG: hypothetical protein F6K39_11445 [Okeania sp. SIO3B3]|nr:hypothetical protein [Okeania sp. SIO3B3]
MKKEEGRRKKEEGRRKKEEAGSLNIMSEKEEGRREYWFKLTFRTTKCSRKT